MNLFKDRAAERPNWENYFLQIAQAVALRGDCHRDQVGAVLVENYSRRILSTGYNGTPPGSKLSCLAGDCPRCNDSSIPSGEQYDKCIEIHAEQNCLDFALSYFPRMEFSSCTMYLTRTPCVNCEPYLREHSVGKVIFPGGYLDLSLPKMG